MSEGFVLAAGSSDTSPVVLAVFLLGGLAALWCGVNWAFDVRGITTRRAERIQRKNEQVWATAGRLGGPSNLFATPGYLRFLGALMVFAGLVLLTATYALWHLG
ncbi:hypothetical protein [Streptomyces sp. NPDC058371]|uniref:hypothetical protein n=1 Tax=Streptomyces sp. NPDC058371 TaxID=3346463 RepID=UPI003665907E